MNTQMPFGLGHWLRVTLNHPSFLPTPTLLHKHSHTHPPSSVHRGVANNVRNAKNRVFQTFTGRHHTQCICQPVNPKKRGAAPRVCVGVDYSCIYTIVWPRTKFGMVVVVLGQNKWNSCTTKLPTKTTTITPHHNRCCHHHQRALHLGVVDIGCLSPFARVSCGVANVLYCSTLAARCAGFTMGC